MSTHRVETAWELGTSSEGDFAASRYSRRHVVRFEGGVELPGSSSPHVVPLPWSDASAVDPEAMFVASLSSCHMLWFLDLASRAGWCVRRYVDRASGTLGKAADGKLAMTAVTLRPEATFADGRAPSFDELARLHHAAHDECFIASSVKTDVRVEPVRRG